MLTYQVETWDEYIKDARALFPQHYEELSIDKAAIKPSCDEDRYKQFYEGGGLMIVTARDDGKLVGYFLFFVFGHMHYKDSGRMGFVDMYYVLPEYRKGTGAKLIALAETTFRELGVLKVYLSCKIHQDHDALFIALGYKATDRIYTKLLR